MPDQPRTVTVAVLLAGSGLPRAEARALLATILGATREAIVAHPERPVDAAEAARFDELARQREHGVPLAYLLGRREFYGRWFAVSPAVLVPRPESELLVDVVTDRLRRLGPPRILDLGTGSGCIAITLGLELAGADVVGVDRSEAALAVAAANAAALGAQGRWIESDWYDALATEPAFDAIVANPPYVADGDPHLAALHAEPRAALVAGPDGLQALRRVIAGATARLRAGGLLAVEHGADQGGPVRTLFRAAGFGAVETRRDAAGLERVTLGVRGDAPASAGGSKVD